MLWWKGCRDGSVNENFIFRHFFLATHSHFHNGAKCWEGTNAIISRGGFMSLFSIQNVKSEAKAVKDPLKAALSKKLKTNLKPSLKSKLKATLKAKLKTL